MRYTLIESKKPRKISQEQAIKIGKSLKGIEVPYRFLRKNAPLRRQYDSALLKNPEHLNVGEFSEDAKRFISISHLCALEEDDFQLADLVEILKFCEENYKGDLRDHLIAALCLDLNSHRLISLFLEFAPSGEDFDPQVGWCRGNEFYTLFFPHFVDFFGEAYTKNLNEKVLQLTESFSFKEEEIDAIRQELKDKPEVYSPQCQRFIDEVISPLLEFLQNSSVPAEIASFVHHSQLFMKSWGRIDINIPQQLCGMLLLKFIIPALQSNQGPAHDKVFRILREYIQKLSTVGEDQRLYHFVTQVAEAGQIDQMHFVPFEEADRRLLSTIHQDYIESAKRLLTESWVADMHAVAQDNSESPRASPRSEEDDEYRALVPIKRADDGTALFSSRSKKIRSTCRSLYSTCTPTYAALTTIAVLLIAAGAISGNSEMLKKEFNHTDPNWENIGSAGTSLISALPGLLFLLVIGTVFLYRFKQGASIKPIKVQSAFNRDNEKPLRSDPEDTDPHLAYSRRNDDESEASAVEEEHSAGYQHN